MDQTGLEFRLTEILARVVGGKAGPRRRGLPAEINPTEEFAVLGINSVDLMEFILRVEQELNIDVLREHGSRRTSEHAPRLGRIALPATPATDGVMIEIRTYDGEPAELAAFCTGVWRDRYGDKMTVPLWNGPYMEWELFPTSRGPAIFWSRPTTAVDWWAPSLEARALPLERGADCGLVRKFFRRRSGLREAGRLPQAGARAAASPSRTAGGPLRRLSDPRRSDRHGAEILAAAAQHVCRGQGGTLGADASTTA